MCHKASAQGAVPEHHEGGSRPLTCANTAGRRRARTDDLRIQNEQAACPLAMWDKMCHLLVIRDGSGSSEEVCRPLTCTNTSGPRRARTDDLRIKRAIWMCGSARILLISCVIDSQLFARRGGGSHARADSLRTRAGCRIVAAGCHSVLHKPQPSSRRVALIQGHRFNSVSSRLVALLPSRTFRPQLSARV
jgi:hypothetical protein